MAARAGNQFMRQLLNRTLCKVQLYHVECAVCDLSCTLSCPFVVILQDIVTRYACSTGRHVTRRFGWDCHGLPVEYEIDKKLGEY
jgi:hypothetical protein